MKSHSPAHVAWSRLIRLLMEQRGRFHALAESHGLSVGMAGAILKLHDRSASMHELARRLHCDNSNVTGLVRRLENRKFVRRTADRTDRRTKLVSLTPAGRRLRTALVRDLEQPPAILKRLTAAEQRQLAKLLEKLTA